MFVDELWLPASEEKVYLWEKTKERKRKKAGVLQVREQPMFDSDHQSSRPSNVQPGTSTQQHDYT
jgi:hypothetical protein